MKQKVTLLLLSLLLGVLSVSAQKKLQFHVVSVKQDQRDTSAKYGKYAKDDGTGSNYAIIKVKSNDPDDELSAFNFDFFYLKHEVESHDGELWVYVQRNAKTVTISRPGYSTVSKYDLGVTTEAGCVYNMQITYDRIIHHEVIDVNKQMVLFKTEPAVKGATVIVKAQKKNSQEQLIGTTDDNGTVSEALPFGKYTYRVMSTGNMYHPKEDIMTLTTSDETHTEVVKLQPNFAEVTLKAADGAEIFIDKESKGTTTWKGILVSGTYVVTSKKAKHRDSQQRVTVKAGVNETIELKEPTPIVGALSIKTSPAGAAINIDGKNYGVSPRIVKDLIIGEHEVTLSLANHKTETRKVTIEEGKTEDINVTLGNIAKMTITTRPAGATLYIDGERVGQTPYYSDMASGDYTIRATKNKYHDYEKRMHLDSSQPNVVLNLSRQYVNPISGYIMPVFQAGMMMAVGGTVGGYICNVNVEGTYLMGMDKSEEIYWNNIGTGNNRPVKAIYKPSFIGGKIGYGFIIGTRSRLTPQAGVGAVSIQSNEDGQTSKANAISASVGLRYDCALASCVGISIAPEYSFAATKSEKFKALEPLSSKIKGWGSGFNCRIGLSIFF